MDDVVKIDSKRADEIMRNLDLNVEQILMGIGFAIEGEYKAHARRDTSAMVNSTYTVGPSKSGLTQARAQAKAAATEHGKTVKIYPHPKPKKNHVHVGPSVNYAIYQEEGTVRGINADHALRNAGNKIAQQFNNPKKWEDTAK